MQDTFEMLEELLEQEQFELLFLHQKSVYLCLIVYVFLLKNHPKDLNHLMKFLDSAALVVSVPAMIAGIWGMNTGGLPGEKSNFGFLAVSAGAMFLAILTAIYLRNKKYSK